MLAYPVVVYKDENGDFGAMVPDLPGCVSAGSSQVEVIQEVTEALYTHLEGMVIDGDDIPAPSVSFDAFQGLFSETGFVCWAIAQIDPAKISKESERLNVTLPKYLVNQITYQPENRSEFLAIAASKELQRRSRA